MATVDPGSTFADLKAAPTPEKNVARQLQILKYCKMSFHLINKMCVSHAYYIK